MTLEDLLDNLFDSADKHGIIKEDVHITIYYKNLCILNFSLELLYRVMPYISVNFCDMFVKRFEQEEKETINIYL